MPTNGGVELNAEFEKIERRSQGRLGVCMRHMESGTTAQYFADERFPLASSVKIPIAVAACHLIDSGRIKESDEVEFTEEDLRVGSGLIKDFVPPIKLSVLNTLHAMLMHSDNTATDKVLRLVGGPEIVKSLMAGFGIRGIDVSRYMSALIAESEGVLDVPPSGKISLCDYQEKAENVTDSARIFAQRVFAADPKDTATPSSLVDLLTKIWTGNVLESASTSLLLTLLSKCRTGANRLRAGLPDGTPIWHKTGTVGGTVNDVGIIGLPNGTHVATAVFVSDPARKDQSKERDIAEVAAFIFDYCKDLSISGI